MSRPILAIHGKPGSGKGTVAKYLIRNHGFTLHKIATPIKNMLRALGLTEDHIEGHLKELPTPLLAGRSPRWGMQTLGKEWRDAMHPDLLIILWENTLPDGPIVLDDLRYPNEVPYLRKHGAKLLHLLRPDHEVTDTGHEAESQTIPCDVTVTNNGTSVYEFESYMEKVLRHDLGVV